MKREKKGEKLLEKIEENKLALPVIPDFGNFLAKTGTLSLPETTTDLDKDLISKGGDIKKSTKKLYTIKLSKGQKRNISGGKSLLGNSSLNIRDTSTGHYQRPAKLESVFLNQVLSTAVGQMQLQQISEKLDEIQSTINLVRKNQEIERIAKLRSVSELIKDKDINPDFKDELGNYKKDLQNLRSEYELLLKDLVFKEVKSGSIHLKLIDEYLTIHGDKKILNLNLAEKDIQSKFVEWLDGEVLFYLEYHNLTVQLLSFMFLYQGHEDRYLKLYDGATEFYSQLFKIIPEKILKIRGMTAENADIQSCMAKFFTSSTYRDKNLEKTFSKLQEIFEKIDAPKMLEIEGRETEVKEID